MSELVQRRAVRALVVPVRPVGCGAHVLWTARLPDGSCTGVGFSSVERLRAVLGPERPYELLSPGVVRSMLHEQGVDLLRVDPELVVQHAGRSRLTA